MSFFDTYDGAVSIAGTSTDTKPVIHDDDVGWLFAREDRIFRKRHSTTSKGPLAGRADESFKVQLFPRRKHSPIYPHEHRLFIFMLQILSLNIFARNFNKRFSGGGYNHGGNDLVSAILLSRARGGRRIEDLTLLAQSEEREVGY